MIKATSSEFRIVIHEKHVFTATFSWGVGRGGAQMFGVIPNIQENIRKCIADDDKARPWGRRQGEEACAEWCELGKIRERRKWFVFRQGWCHLILFVT